MHTCLTAAALVSLATLCFGANDTWHRPMRIVYCRIATLLQKDKTCAVYVFLASIGDYGNDSSITCASTNIPKLQDGIA